MNSFVKTMFACLVAIMVAGFVLPIVWIVFFVGFAVSAGSNDNGIKENSVLFIELDGMLEERSDANPLASFMGDDYKVRGLDDIIASIKAAAKDDDIKGIYLQAGAMQVASLASLEEMRGELAAFKESGKFIVAYADQYSQELYYLSTIADMVAINPYGTLSWHGFASQPIFYKDLLEKVGVEMQIFKVGTYKSAVEPFIATKMSDADREQVAELLNSSWRDITSAVSESRSIPVDKLNEYADRFMDFRQAQEYIDCGLVDTLLYKDGMLACLKQLTNVGEGDKLSLVTPEEMNEYPQITGEGSGKIAVYYAFGEIDSSTSTDEGINSQKVIKELRELREDSSVNAVVLRVNSPGGSAYGSEQIWREVMLLKAAKPVVVSMGDYAASGGYYISCAADCIVANSTTLTGSIGIFGMFPSAEKLLKDKLGLNFDVVKTNRMADFGAYSRPFNADECDVLQEYVENGYALFLKRCADGRGMSVDDIGRIAEGRVWTGRKAKELGLVDEIGDLDKAVEIAAKLAGVEGYSVESYPGAADFITKLMDSDKDDYMKSVLKSSFGDLYDVAEFMRGVYGCDPLQARMPFELNIK